MLFLTAFAIAAIEVLPRLSTSLDPGLGMPLTYHSTSVVAVHGLNFKGSPTHAQDTWMKGDKLWLSDFLPAELPTPARVMVFAYNSSPAIGASAIKLDDHARSLLHWLKLERAVSYRL
jgi:hypothetical protein